MSDGSQTPRADSRVSSGAAEIAVSSYGEGAPILALHAGVCDRRSWQWCAPIWAEHGFRTVAYDRRGFGDTRYDAESHDSLADLRAVSGALHARPAIVLGNSMGGGLAIDLTLAHPDEVLALVLIGSLPSGAPFDEWQTSEAEAALEAQVDAAQQSGDVERVNELEVQYWLDGPAQPAGRVSGEPRRLMLEMNGRALRASAAGDDAPRGEAWPRLGEVTAPTLVLVGEYDEVGLGRLTELMVAGMPRARSHRMLGTAHCPMLDTPDELAETVLEFLRDAGVGTQT